MSRRLLIIEPDAAGRTMMERVLTAEGFAADTAASALAARPLLDAGLIEVVIVDELAGSRVALEEVRWRAPQVPDPAGRRHRGPALAPGDAGAAAPARRRRARQAVHPGRAARGGGARRRAEGSRTTPRPSNTTSRSPTRGAPSPRGRARARGRRSRGRRRSRPCDSEIMALWALSAELDGNDAGADRAYRAALALRDDEANPPPDPHEGLARLAAYGGARPVAALDAARAGQPLWLVTDPATELRAGPDGEGPPGGDPVVVVMALGLVADAPGRRVFFRDGGGPRAFALIAGALRPDSLARRPRRPRRRAARRRLADPRAPGPRPDRGAPRRGHACRPADPRGRAASVTPATPPVSTSR